MGMSTHVIGIKPPDATFRKMLAAHNACEDAGIPVPKEVRKYFNDEEPNELGVELDQETLGDAVVECGWEGAHGFDVHLDKLPKDIKIIRFYNSW